MDASRVLRELAAIGVTAWPSSHGSFATDDGKQIYISARGRTPTPADVERDVDGLGFDELILYIVNRMTPNLREAALRDARLIILDGNTTWANAAEYPHDAPAPPTRGRGRRPYVRYAVMRALLLDPTPRRQLDLAEEAGTTQSVISHALRSLDDDGVLRGRGGITIGDWSMMWNTCVVGYPGTGGITTHWWHDSPLEEQADRMRRLAAKHDVDSLTSGDLTARQIAPWRQPEHATLYLGAGVDPTRAGFALASADDHTLAITVPDDRTVFATAAAHPAAPGHVDGVLAAIDVARTGTTGDQDEAAGRIRDVLLARWKDAAR